VSAAPSIDPAGQIAPAAPVLGADATQALFERHAGAIYGYCLNRLGGREEAEDAVQTTFLNAFRALRRGVVPEFEAAWLYKIAENVCRERNRSARRRLEVVQDPTAIEESAPAATQTGRDELLGLDDALERMPPRQRHALLLREWKGFSYREIAQELRLSPSAVETLLFRARRSLARNLQVGSLLPWLKSLLGGSAAMKTAAAASVVVASASLGGGGPVEPQTRPEVQKRPAAVAPPPATATATTPGGKTVVSQTTTSAERSRRAEPARGKVASTTPTARRKAPLPAGTSAPSEPGTPVAGGEDVGSTAPPPPAVAPPPAPTSPAASPPPPASPLPAVPPASLPVTVPPAPPPPALPQLPGLPALPPPPLLPPAPQLPAPELPTLPQLPLLPPPPPLPELPKLP
jgi:RNA polymerase sigma factor (sigma-70 family)